MIEGIWDFMSTNGEKIADVFSMFANSWNPMQMMGSVVEGLTSVDLVEPLIESATTYIYQLITQNFIVLIEVLLQKFNPTSNFVYNLFGMTGGYNSTSFSVFFYIAAFSLIGLFVFNLFIIGLGGLVDQKNEVHELLVRFFASIVIILLIRLFFQLLNITTDVIISLCAFATYDSMGDNQFTGDFGSGQLSQVFLGILMIIIIVAMLFEFIKLIMSIIERYLVEFLLHIISPVAGSFFVSRTTSAILSNYVRMYLSQLFMLVMSKFFLYLFVMAIMNNVFSDFIGCLALITFLKCAQRIDTYIRSLGLTVAQTGNALFGSILASVGTMGLALRGGRNATSAIGRAVEIAGASQGSFGMSKIGTLLRSASGRNPYSESAAFRAYTENGGLANTVSGNAKVNKTFMDLVNSGNYRTAMGTPTRIQTSAIKETFGQDGHDAFYQATGLHASDITSAQVMMDGSIKGIAETQGNNGSLNKYGFMVSPNTIVGGNVAKTSVFSSGQMFTSVTPSKANHYAGMKFSNLDFASYGNNISPVSTLTGAKIDNQKWSNLGVVSAIVTKDNILVGSNAVGQEVAAINLDTGSRYDCGTASSILNSAPLAYYSAENVLADPEIQSMLPKGASVVENSFNVVDASPSSYKANFDWKSNMASGQMVIERPSPIDIKKDAHSTIIYKGPEVGCFKITNNKKSQSNTIVGR